MQVEFSLKVYSDDKIVGSALKVAIELEWTELLHKEYCIRGKIDHREQLNDIRS